MYLSEDLSNEKRVYTKFFFVAAVLSGIVAFILTLLFWYYPSTHEFVVQYDGCVLVSNNFAKTGYKYKNDYGAVNITDVYFPPNQKGMYDCYYWNTAPSSYLYLGVATEYDKALFAKKMHIFFSSSTILFISIIFLITIPLCMMFIFWSFVWSYESVSPKS
jgi:hypothetical protein